MRVPHVLVPLVAAAVCGCSSGTMPKLSGTAGTDGGAVGGAGTSGGTGTFGGAGTSGRAGTSGGGAGASGSGPGGSGGAGRGGTTGNGGGGGTTTNAGCGLATPPTVGAANPQTINVTDSKGTTLARQFYVSLPSTYDPNTPTRVIFAWHYAGGSASALIAGRGAFYGVQASLPSAIYVAAQGLLSTAGDATTSGWPNTNGGDIAFAKAMIAWMESNFCVDTTRIMSTGMSYGGIMSDAIGCQMPDVFRALGVMSGSLFSSGVSCKSHPIAAWITHGDADPTVDISGDEKARDQFLADNHCGTTSTAVTPSPCLSYDSCDNGYPVVWCPVAGEGHTIPSFAASGIADFFARF